MKAKVIVYGKVVAKVGTTLAVFLAVIGGCLATSTIESSKLPMPPSWRPYMESIAFAGIVLKWGVVPAVEGLVKGIKAALAELSKSDEV